MSVINFLQYSFVERAFLAGSFVAVVCSMLGLLLVLRQMSLIGDGLAHVSFGAIALGLFFGIYPFYVAVPAVIVGAIVILKISEQAKIYGDAAIGIVSAIGIASGVIIASLSQGFNVDLFSYLFGNILAISRIEVFLSILLSFGVLSFICFYYWDFFSASFDEEYARTTGVKVDFINKLLAILTAVTVVLAVRTVGTMLVSALLVLPAVTALQIARGFKAAMVISAVVSLLSVFSGIMFSFVLDLPSGAVIVMMNGLFFGLVFLYQKIIR